MPFMAIAIYTCIISCAGRSNGPAARRFLDFSPFLGPRIQGNGNILVRARIIGDPPPYVNCHTVRPYLRRLHLPNCYLTRE